MTSHSSLTAAAPPTPSPSNPPRLTASHTSRVTPPSVQSRVARPTEPALPAAATLDDIEASSTPASQPHHLLPVWRRGLVSRESLGPRLPHRVRVALFVWSVFAIAVGASAMITAGLGAGPADVLIAAIASHVGIAHGSAALGFSATMLTVALIARGGVRAGTIALALSVGPLMNVVMPLMGSPSSLWLQSSQFVWALTLTAFGVAATIQAAYGPGSLELITVRLSRWSGSSFAVIRVGIEVSFAVVGALLGGAAGAATVVFALAFGPVVAYWVAVLGRLLSRWAAPLSAPPVEVSMVRASRL